MLVASMGRGYTNRLAPEPIRIEVDDYWGVIDQRGMTTNFAFFKAQCQLQLIQGKRTLASHSLGKIRYKNKHNHYVNRLCVFTFEFIEGGDEVGHRKTTHVISMPQT